MRQSPWEAEDDLVPSLLALRAWSVIARSPEGATRQSPWEFGDTLALSLLALRG
ncbi:MAG TPA: hypothetical protein PKY35_12765 [Candidatus Hydrogenedentes bacterium]|nr:hypothetical protein [Candidatus Hydrogenedentota bacterium]HPO87054.1 hypothetical protein [Candidatus Hydrogenedentota bacterium]